VERRLSEQRRQELQDAFLTAFARSGIITRAIDESNVPYQYHRRWLVNDVIYAEKFDQLQQETIELRHRSHGNAVRDSKTRLTAEERSAAARRSHTPESDQKRREAMQRKWDDPEYQARRAETEAKPETKIRRSAAAVEMNNRPERRAFQSDLMRSKFANDEEFRTRHSNAMKLVFVESQQRISRSESMKRAWVENPEAFSSSIEAFRVESRSDTGRRRRKNLGAARAAKSPITPQEHLVTLALNNVDVPYFVHRVMDGWELDVYVPSYRLDIEIDGGNHVGEENEAHDADRDTQMIAAGIHVLRLPHLCIRTGEFAQIIYDRLDSLSE
jgi:very-short-patch-repair endonuclease